MDTKIDMKKLCLFIMTFLSLQHQYAQAPARINYQSVIRNSSNNLLVNTPVKIRVSILQGSATGSVVFSELLNPTSNNVGLIQLEIGSGSNQTGTISGIDWSKGPYFLKTETDPSNGSNYTLVGTTQILSVPYALSSGNGIKGISISGDTLYLDNGKKFIIPGIKDVSSIALVTGVTSHTCGAASVHNPSVAYGSLTDQDGNIYRTVQIGTQTWMAENLRTTKYQNGQSINSITEKAKWNGLTTGAFASYDYTQSYDCPYGKLYNWYAVNNPNKLCPSGWHVPSLSEWNQMFTFLGGTSQSMIKLKSSGSTYWTAPTNVNGSNSSGFSALPGGIGSPDGTHGYINWDALWWSSTESGSNAVYIAMRNAVNTNNVYSFPDNKNYGKSIRCVKD